MKYTKKELKRFDPILKEIFSEAIGTIYYLVIGKKSCLFDVEIL